jgi:hypothetical protein
VAVTLSTAAKNAALDAITAGLGGSGSVILYFTDASGSSVTKRWLFFAFDPASGGAASIGGVPLLNTDDFTSGTVTIARFDLFKSGDFSGWHIGGTVGLPGSGAEVEITGVVTVSGQKCSLSSFTLSIA